MMSDSIIDVPVDDSDYEYEKQEKLRAEAESRKRDEEAPECLKCGEVGHWKVVGDEVIPWCATCNL